MRNLLLVIVTILSLYSCKKCADCKRTWNRTSYTLHANGSRSNIKTTDGEVEEFEVCGSNDIKNAEKPTKEYYRLKSGNDYFISEGTSKCVCVN